MFDVTSLSIALALFHMGDIFQEIAARYMYGLSVNPSICFFFICFPVLLEWQRLPLRLSMDLMFMGCRSVTYKYSQLLPAGASLLWNPVIVDKS